MISRTAPAPRASYGEYEVQYMAGTGTFAKVFRAAHRDTGQVVAVKVLRSEFSIDRIRYGSFLREGELGRSLRHPNIVPIYEVHSDGQVHYLVMEFAEGTTLREFVKIRKRLAPKEATRLMADVARGLDYAFQRCVTHRDLRMSNVLISSRGEAKLADFGLAAVSAEARAAKGDNTPGRTVEYAALERATGVRRDDARSDTYFAGCMYYHMLTGVSPLYDDGGRARRVRPPRFRQIVPIQHVVPSLPLYVANVVNRAMALEPSRRHQTPGELLADFESVMRRLEEDARAADSDSAAGLGQDGRIVAADRKQRCVIVVEGDPHGQNVLREGLKEAGYRVLLTGDPQRAFNRLSQEPGIADCIILSAQQIGQPAVDCFNRLSVYDWSRSLPALLLLSPTQFGWSARARASGQRCVLTLPVNMKQLRATLKRLLIASEPHPE